MAPRVGALARHTRAPAPRALCSRNDNRVIDGDPAAVREVATRTREVDLGNLR